jgi:hypothetical protein
VPPLASAAVTKRLAIWNGVGVGVGVGVDGGFYLFVRMSVCLCLSLFSDACIRAAALTKVDGATARSTAATARRSETFKASVSV